MKIPRLEEFLIGLQKSWEEAMKSMEVVQEVIKKQFDRKRRNLQELKIGDNRWLEAKNIYSNRSSKKLDQKRYGLFRISKDIGQGTFQLELLEG